MKYRPSFAVRVVLLVLVSGPLLSLLFIQSIPSGNNLWGESLNAGHSVLFGVIAVMLLWTLKTQPKFTNGTLLRQYLTVGITVQLMGVATELIQPYFHRDCEVGDMIRDGTGIFVFLSILALFNHRLDGDGRKVNRQMRLSLVTVVIFCAIGVSLPADAWALAYLHRAREFPVVASYDSWLSRKFLLTPDAELTPVDPPAGWTTDRPTICGLIAFSPARFPGLTVQEVEPDWRGYDSLQFDVFSPMDTSVVLALRVDDRRHDYSFNDRYNSTLRIAPGLNHISVALADIEHAAKKRKLNLGAMARILLFAVDLKSPFSLYLGPIRLIR